MMGPRVARTRRALILVLATAGLGVTILIAGSFGTDPSAASSNNGSPDPTPQVLPAAKNMGVFSSSVSADDRALFDRSSVRSEVALTTEDVAGIADALLPGAASTTSFRALMTGVGTEGRSIWAVVTAKGRVCSGLTGFTSGCIAAFSSPEEHVTKTVGRATADTPVVVWGLAPDDVARVDVVVNGRVHAARMGRNAFYYELADVTLGDDAIEALLVTLTDETRAPIEIELAPSPAPPID
jgi:hypothetical protein